ncbi:MAG: insulinase family protein, partial [Nannocystaceae bacterium]|nr:insulinase family protein [Nannocystaceae bacterium]
YTNLIQFDVRHRVGSRDDPPGKAAMAHFVEHLMFQMPVDGPGTTPLFTDAPTHTLTFNAYTAADITHYMHTGTTDELETYMKYTKLRLGYDCDAVAETEFVRERDVVRNEHRLRGQNVNAELYTKVLAKAYPPGHPYRTQNFADIDTQIASITPEDACTFIGKHYVASNATLVVTGNVDPIEVLSLAKKYLGGLPKVAPPARPVVPPAKFLSKNVQIEAPVKKPSAMILFRQPPRFTPDAVAAQAALQTMLTAVAFFTRNKRESVVKKWNYTGLGGGEAQLIGIEIETEKVRDLDRGVDEVLDAITRGFSPELKGKDGKGTYDSVRQRTRLELLSQLANIGARSGAYADYLDERTDNPGMLGKELFLLDELKPERAQKVGRKWFSREEAMVIKVVPDGSEQAKIDRASFGYEPKEEDQMSVPDDIDPAEAHEPLKVNVATTEAGQSIEYQLENGMPVVLVQSTDIPVMDIQVIVRAGEVDSEKHAAIADLSNSLFSLQEGDRDGANLMQFFDLAGGVFGSNVGPKATTFTSRGLSVYLDFIIAGLSQIVVNAGYQTSSLELWKLSEKKRLEKPSYLQRANRERAFNEALFGKGHPHIRPAITNPKVLRDLKLSDLEAFREKHYRAANSAIIITGGFDMELAIQYIERYFGSPLLRERGNTWNEPRTGTTRKTAPEPKPGKVRYMTEMDKKKVQTDVFIAYPMAEVYGEDHAALLVLAAMLNFNVAAVRMKLGASYGIYSRVDASRPSLVIGGALDSAKAGEGFGAIKQAVQAVRDGNDFDRLFAFARRETVRTMLGQQGDPKGLANQLARAMRADRPYDYFQTLVQQVATLKPEQVKEILDRIVRENRAVTLIQGPQLGIDNILKHNKITGVTKLLDAVDRESED